MHRNPAGYGRFLRRGRVSRRGVAASRERTMPLPARAGLMRRKPDCAERPVSTPAADCGR